MTTCESCDGYGVFDGLEVCDDCGWEWAVRFSPDGNNHIQRDEQSARAFASQSHGTLLRRSRVVHQAWVEVPTIETGASG